MTAASIAGGVSTWMLVVDIHAAAVGLVDGFVGLSAGYLGSIHGFSTHPLPAGSYNNTRVS